MNALRERKMMKKRWILFMMCACISGLGGCGKQTVTEKAEGNDHGNIEKHFYRTGKTIMRQEERNENYNIKRGT